VTTITRPTAAMIRLTCATNFALTVTSAASTVIPLSSLVIAQPAAMVTIWTHHQLLTSARSALISVLIA
jgi:hypothetical protein